MDKHAEPVAGDRDNFVPVRHSVSFSILTIRFGKLKKRLSYISPCVNGASTTHFLTLK